MIADALIKGPKPILGNNRPAAAGAAHQPRLIVVSSLYEIDGLVSDAVDQPVFLCYTP